MNELHKYGFKKKDFKRDSKGFICVNNILVKCGHPENKDLRNFHKSRKNKIVKDAIIKLLEEGDKLYYTKNIGCGKIELTFFHPIYTSLLLDWLYNDCKSGFRIKDDN